MTEPWIEPLQEIELPGEDPPLTIEQELRRAVYNASMYNRVTKIRRNHQVAYLIPEFIYQRLVALSKEGDE